MINHPAIGVSHDYGNPQLSICVPRGFVDQIPVGSCCFLDESVSGMPAGPPLMFVVLNFTPLKQKYIQHRFYT